LAVLAGNPNYHDAIDRLFTLLEMFSSKSKEAIPSSSGNLRLMHVKLKWKQKN